MNKFGQYGLGLGITTLIVGALVLSQPSHKTVVVPVKPAPVAEVEKPKVDLPPVVALDVKPPTAADVPPPVQQEFPKPQYHADGTEKVDWCTLTHGRAGCVPHDLSDDQVQEFHAEAKKELKVVPVPKPKPHHVEKKPEPKKKPPVVKHDAKKKPPVHQVMAQGNPFHCLIVFCIVTGTSF